MYIIIIIIIRVKQREIQTLHCSKWFTFFNAYSAQVFIWTHDIYTTH
jgi:hypothetical protein